MNNLEIKVMQYLDSCGFRHSLLGFKYASIMIIHCLENPEDLLKIGDLYKKVAKKANSTPDRMERALRHEIKTSIMPEMTNKEFIARAVDNLRISLKLDQEGTDRG